MAFSQLDLSLCFIKEQVSYWIRGHTLKLFELSIPDDICNSPSPHDAKIVEMLFRLQHNV
jgi:hypothetical protein